MDISNTIADIQNNIINRDCNFDDIGELNKCMALEKEVILNVNIRGLLRVHTMHNVMRRIGLHQAT